MIAGNAIRICDWWQVNENTSHNALLLVAKNRSNRRHLALLILGGD